VNQLWPLAGSSHGQSLGPLFDSLVLLQRRSPASIYWLHPLPDAEGTYLTTWFLHPALHRYRGHELMIFTRERGAYCWMPGAQRDGTGQVPLGDYLVELELTGSARPVRLRLEKRHPAAFVLAPPAPMREDSAEPVHRLQPRPLPPGVLRAELHALVETSLNFQLQALHAGLMREQAATLMADGAVSATCRGCSPQLDTLLGLIEDELASSAGSEPP
jgi:hypothetical protein